MDDDELAERLDAVANLAAAESYLDRFAESLGHAERGIAVARATGQGELFPVLIPAVNAALFGLGRLAESVELLDGAIEGARLMGNAQPLAWHLLSSAAARMMCGDLDGALSAATESVELSRDLGVSLVSSYAEAILGLVHIERGDVERGVERLVGSLGGPSLPESPGNWRAWDLERLAQAWLALGRRAEATQAVADAESFAASTELRFGAALAGRARARLALAGGDPAVAAEHALGSVGAAEEIDAVAEAALSLLVAGRALAAAGEADRAAEPLERAAAALERAGAVRYRDEAELELGRLGRRRHRRTRPGRSDGAGVEALTERELQVARLIVDRRTNAQIAADLFLSKKTVETHVRNLFVKLDVSSRVDVARVVERADREAAVRRWAASRS
jgi:DNA-binding CsgD family transcriptional regulator